MYCDQKYKKCHKDTKYHKDKYELLTPEKEKTGKTIVIPVCEEQLLSHLKLIGKRPGYLINFNVPLIKDGIKRIVI